MNITQKTFTINKEAHRKDLFSVKCSLHVSLLYSVKVVDWIYICFKYLKILNIITAGLLCDIDSSNLVSDTYRYICILFYFRECRTVAQSYGNGPGQER